MPEGQKITKKQIEDALFHLQNNILTKPSLDIRHRLLDVRMFDEFTTSNAESEHASLKSRGTGVNNKTSLKDLFLKSMKAAEMRSNDKDLKNITDLEKTDINTNAELSKHVTKHCFNEMVQRVELSKRCISKQTDMTHWIVIYMPTQLQKLQPNVPLHFLPRIKRKRYVTITNGVLNCSCKTMERFGYPCHHLLHVMAVPSIHDIKSEWIHIRWFKKYLVEYCEPSIEEKVQKQYDYMYTNHPNGVQCVPTSNSYITYPILRGPEDIRMSSLLFDVPDFQLLSRTARMLWIQQNKSSNKLLNQMLRKNDPNIFEKEINLSQSQQSIDELMTNDFDIQLDDLDNEDVELESNNLDCFSLWKRAQSLCEKDKSKKLELYKLLEGFVITNETNHNDNEKLLARRDKDTTTTISSNKIIHNNKSGAKRSRYKAFFEN